MYLVESWTYYKWTNNGSLSLISSWPPPPDNVHLDEHIHALWQCGLRNHESSLTKGPFTSLRINFAEVPFQDTCLDWEPVDEEQRTRNDEQFSDIKLITGVDTGGHASDLALTLKGPGGGGGRAESPPLDVSRDNFFPRRNLSWLFSLKSCATFGAIFGLYATTAHVCIFHDFKAKV